MSNSCGNPVQLTRQQKDLRIAFQSTKSVSEMLKKLKEMESCFQESELGMECWTLANSLHSQGNSTEKVLSFGKRALQIFITNYDNNICSFGKSCSRFLINVGDSGIKCTYNHKSALFIACICNLLGSASFDLKRFNESLSYLNWANRNLSKVEHDEDGSCSGKCVLHALHCTHFQLFLLKLAMGRREDSFVHARKLLDIKEKTMEEGCIELGKANKMVSDAYLMVANFEESLPFALKAVEIFAKHIGDDSVEQEVAQVKRNLGTIYGVLGEHEKSLELAQLSLSGLKSMECSSLWLSAQMEIPNRLLALGRNEEGIEALKSLLPLAESEGNQQVRGCSFMCMARGYCNLGKFSDTRKYMKIAQRIFEKKKMMIGQMTIASAFDDMSIVYEDMKDYESAISYLRKSLAIPELPEKHFIASSSRLFPLISLTGKVKRGIPYLEEVLERLKERLGPEHCEVGYGYMNLGAAYLKSDQEELAVKFMEKAKDIMDVKLGPHHLDSLRASHTLSITYATMRRYGRAIEIQEKVIGGLKSLVPSQQNFLDEAVMYLNEMKERVADPTWSKSQFEDGDDLSATISKCEISDDGKVS